MESVDQRSVPVRRVLIVGFMASGKTTVGRRVAELIGWTFCDFDEVIQERAGQPPHSIIRDRGERHFREIEHQVGRDLLELENVVLASGGGWPSEGDHMAALPQGTATVWLQVEADTAVQRATGDGPTRPLLSVDDPLTRAGQLIEARRWAYEKADLALSSEDEFPHALAESIVRWIRRVPGGECSTLGEKTGK